MLVPADLTDRDVHAGHRRQRQRRLRVHRDRGRRDLHKRDGDDHDQPRQRRADVLRGRGPGVDEEPGAGRRRWTTPRRSRYESGQRLVRTSRPTPIRPSFSAGPSVSAAGTRLHARQRRIRSADITSTSRTTRRGQRRRRHQRSRAFTIGIANVNDNPDAVDDDGTSRGLRRDADRRLARHLAAGSGRDAHGHGRQQPAQGHGNRHRWAGPPPTRRTPRRQAPTASPTPSPMDTAAPTRPW